MMLEMVALYTLCIYSLLNWELWVILGILLVVLFFSQPLLFHHKPSTTPVTYGHVCGAVFIHLMLFYGHVTQYLYGLEFLVILFTIVLIPYWYYLIRSHFTKPGYYQGPIINRSNISNSIHDTLSCENFCVTCIVS